MPLDVIALDQDFSPLSFLPYLNLQWRRRYYEAGQFVVQILAKDYDSRMKYVYAPTRPELGIIHKVSLSRELTGDFVQLSGRFMESVLERCYAYPPIVGTYSLYELGKQFIEDRPTPTADVSDWQYRLEEYDLTVSPNVPDDVTVSVDWQSEPLGTLAYTTLETLEMSQRILFDPLTNALTWETWQGLDRTQDQAVNAFALFADDSPHVTTFSYGEDDSGYRNYAVMFYGADEDDNPYRHDYATSNAQAEGKRCLLMNVDDTLSESERIEKAKEELVKYPVVLDATVSVVQNGLLYLQDYDLGDKCDVACHILGKSFSARITGVDEVFKENRHLVELTIGQGTKTIYQQLARFARSAILSKSITKIS